MGTTLNRSAYEKLVAEDIEWLLRQPRTLERDHIEQILRDSPQRLYPPARTLRQLESLREAPPGSCLALAQDILARGMRGYGDRLLTADDAAHHAAWSPASGHKRGWRVTRGIAPMEEHVTASGKVRFFRERSTAQRVADGLNSLDADRTRRHFNKEG